MAFTVDQAFELIEAAHQRQRLAHAFLISGVKGGGAEELAARVITMLQSNGEDAGIDLFGEAVEPEVPALEELEGEWVRILRPHSKSRQIKVDHIRNLERSLNMVAGPSVWKIGVIVDADRMMPASENAFLKTLEEPPPQTLLLLLTSNPSRLLPTVLSRCVNISLLGKPNLHAGGGAELVEALNQAAEHGLGTPQIALGLKAKFSGILGEKKAEALAAAKELLKEEEKVLKNAIEGDWLKRREEELKAIAESDYLNHRSRLFEVLQAWMADVLRCKTGAGGLDFPENAAQTGMAAKRETLPVLLKRMEAISELQATLDTNAQEQLALEVGFIKAFG